jgi:hypothetical protein
MTPVTEAATPATTQPADGPARPGVLGTARLLLGNCRLTVLLLPFVVGLAVAQLKLNEAIDAGPSYRDAMEVVALCVLAPALLLALVGARREGTGPGWWVVGLVATLFMREVHFTGTSTGVYVGLLILSIVLVRHAAPWRQTLVSPGFATPLVVAFGCYFMSQTLDQRWWKFLPAEDVWHTVVEETLEVTGHVFILALSWLATRGSGSSSG